MRRPFRSALRSGAASRCRPSLAVKWKVLPLPGSLSTPIWPSIISTSRLLIVGPRPVPPYLRVVEASACEKAEELRAAAQGSGRCRCLDLEAHEHRCSPRRPCCTRDDDLALLGELDRVAARLSSTCPSRSGSPTSAVGTSVRLKSNSRPFSSALIVTGRRVVQDLLQVELGGLDVRWPGLDLREVEDVVDDPQQVLRRRSIFWM